MKNLYFNENNKPFELEESSSLFVMRVLPNANPVELLEKIPELIKSIQHFDILASFPESNVYIFIVEKKALHTIEEVKLLIRKQNFPDLIFVGSVFQYLHTDVYQIYTGNIFIKFQDTLSELLCEKFLNTHSLEVKMKLGFAQNAYFLEDKSNQGREIFELCIQLLAFDEVQNCHPEMVTKLRPTLRNNETFEAPEVNRHNWWIDQLKMHDAWKFTKGKQTTIAIIDDGIELNHPAFMGKIVHARDMMDKTNTKLPAHQYSEKHGTACASIAASQDEEALGVAPFAYIMPIRITGLGSVLQSEAIYWAVNSGADVISCSWGPPDGNIFTTKDDDFYFPLPDHTRLAFEYAALHGRNGKGCPIVFAAGNGKDSADNDGYASNEHVIAVSAVNRKNQSTIYSDYGKCVWCCFPSGDFIYNNQTGKASNHSGIKVADRIGEAGYSPDDYYSLFTGTSASAPGVAGLIALMYSVSPTLSLNQVKQILKETATKVSHAIFDVNGHHLQYGYGLVNPTKAISQAFNLKNIMNTRNTNSAISLHIGIDIVNQSYYSNYVSPLNGCVKDMNTMKNFAQGLGYVTHTLQNSEATKAAIVQKMKELGNSLSENGILMISYAGHGVQIPQTWQAAQEHKEEDGKDESWVVYDGFLLDNDIHNALAAITKAIRVVVVSDSCHSQTMTRDFDYTNTDVNTPRPRQISTAALKAILDYNHQSLEDIRNAGGSRNATFKVQVKNLSACLSTELAQETSNGGYFTNNIVSVYKDLEKAKDTYQTYIDKIRKKIYFIQNPNLSNSHKLNADFDNQFPFEINPPSNNSVSNTVSTNTTTNNTSTDGSSSNTTEKDPKVVDTGQVVVNKPKKGFFKKLWSKITGRNIQAPWDRAYAYLLENELDGSVEPHLISAISYPADDSLQRGISGYLDTYPSPEEYNYHQPFIWHLMEEFSQLKQANETVFPEYKLGKTPIKKQKTVKIAHIDTGYLKNHPTLPENILEPITFELTGAEKDAIDKDLKGYPAEQQGHGNGTMSLLAGKWVDLETTNNDFQGYFGAIPGAQVLPIKISETVVLLSGVLFAKAVDYAIQKGCDVITMSMAGLHSTVMAAAVNNAYEAGVVIVSAAGNNWSKGLQAISPKKTLYPARYDRVIAAVGATFTKRPYLNNFNTKTNRAAGGRFMQSCYGPASVMPTTVAAYSPNVMWFHQMNQNGEGYYTKSGGGTSSATPQIAAAAALYVQHYTTELAQYTGKNAWKKAEIVRQALFLSADKNSEFTQEYFGNGLLKAADMLLPQFSPKVIVKNISKAKEAPESRKIMGGLPGLLTGRSLGMIDENKALKLEAMLLSEINQLVYLDPALFQFQEVDFESETIDLKKYPELLHGLIESKSASQFLKSTLSNFINQSMGNDSNAPYTTLTDDNTYFDNLAIEPLELKKGSQYKEIIGETKYWIEEYSLPISEGRGGESTDNISLSIPTDENQQLCMLLEYQYEGETILAWEWPIAEENPRGGKKNEHASRFEIKLNGANQRGVGNILKNIFIKIFKSAKIDEALPQVLENLGDSKYQLMVYNLENPFEESAGWKNLQTITDAKLKEGIIKEINQSQKNALLMLPGLFSTVEAGFDDYLEISENRAFLLKNHCKYAIGLNMPTVIHGIEKNAEKINDLLVLHFKHKKCNVLARSRGGVVARYLFEKKWINDNTKAITPSAPFTLDKMIMFGTPNQGTKIASYENWKSLLNLTTNISRLTLGTTLPIVPKVLTVVKAVGLGIVNLPGIADLEEDSAIIEMLNKTELNRSNYFVFTSNYEPNRKILKRLFDELFVDRAIFHREYNDSITPVLGAVFKKENKKLTFTLDTNQYYLADPAEQVSHFSYLHAKHPKIIKKVHSLLA